MSCQFVVILRKDKCEEMNKEMTRMGRLMLFKVCRRGIRRKTALASLLVLRNDGKNKEIHFKRSCPDFLINNFIGSELERWMLGNIVNAFEISVVFDRQWF
ncbi:hypothetical protein P5673_009009 [Acropora cervicornis]|uniref:Uncharacterized protein n=1 Tax=Acropora cervicornis TaxID=6130 RepID=A0AAD9VAD5_ACRCE|nr:hypothetical protein P5673_009009 [Acropora cervicornis]